MLPRNSAALCSFRDHTAILGQFRLKIGFSELLNRTFLGFHIGKRGERAGSRHRMIRLDSEAMRGGPGR